MKRPFVKVCGITREIDARAALDAGAHAIGFILIPESPRYIDPGDARAIASRLPESVARVGVVADMQPGTVRGLVASIGLTAIQAHGKESMAMCREYGVPTVKALPAGAEAKLSDFDAFRTLPILLDGFSPSARGGTGNTANWDLARSARENGYCVLLAGGLGPENVLDAVRRVGPVAVDLNSGVEIEPGIKSGPRIQQCLKALQMLEPMEEQEWPW